MLNLAADTPEDWASGALAHLDEVLLDHCHLEKRAASVALGQAFRYQDQPTWQAPLSALAREELEHYELMLDVLQKRSIPFVRQTPSPYAERLRAAVRKGPEKTLDGLLCSALVEARSCERMKLLHQALPEGELSELYGSLLASEARHHHFYVDLATQRFGRERTRERLAELAAHEADVMLGMPRMPRLHAR